LLAGKKHERIVKMVKNNKFYLPCDCGREMILFDYETWKDGSKDLYISFLVDACNSNAKNFWSIIKNRIVFAWTILRGKEYSLFDIVVENETIEKFKEWINEEL
jgi:hypothetical protein